MRAHVCSTPCARYKRSSAFKKRAASDLSGAEAQVASTLSRLTCVAASASQPGTLKAAFGSADVVIEVRQEGRRIRGGGLGEPVCHFSGLKQAFCGCVFFNSRCSAKSSTAAVCLSLERPCWSPCR